MRDLLESSKTGWKKLRRGRTDARCLSEVQKEDNKNKGSKVSPTIIGVTNTFFRPSKTVLGREQGKYGRRWRESIITSQGEVNNWSNVSLKSPSLTTKSNVKIKATHHNYKILTDQSQLANSASAAARLFVPRLSPGSTIQPQIHRTSKLPSHIDGLPGCSVCRALISSSPLSFQNGCFIKTQRS